jgi:SPP1 gp7 family putative phage head morphogenesis protein
MIRSDNIQMKIGDLLARHMAAANLLGRSQIAREVYRKTGKVIPIATTSRHHSGKRHFIHFDEADDTDDLSLGFSLKLPADGSANYLRNLTPVTRDTFDGLTTQYKRDAFTVAGVSDVRIIQKVRDELADVMQKGGTRADFEAAVKKITGDAGVADITAFTLDTVFTTNMQKAYSLGRYEQMTDPDVAEALPFWQYFTVGDDRVRPEHAVLDGFQARVGDPVWNKIYPPNGFNCRCIVIALLASEAGDEASEPGYARLPLLAKLKVPTPGFTKVFAAAT